MNEDFSHHICIINKFQCGFAKICAHLLIFLGLCWFWIWFCWYAYLSWCLKGISHTHTYYASQMLIEDRYMCILKGLSFSNLEQNLCPTSLIYAIFFFYICQVWLKHITIQQWLKPRILGQIFGDLDPSSHLFVRIGIKTKTMHLNLLLDLDTQNQNSWKFTLLKKKRQVL